jgi:hypothetical protein
MGSGTSVEASMGADPMAVVSMVEEDSTGAEDLSVAMVAVQAATGIKQETRGRERAPRVTLARGALCKGLPTRSVGDKMRGFRSFSPEGTGLQDDKWRFGTIEGGIKPPLQRR